MCNRKPGSRCSSHARATLVDANNELGNALRTRHEAHFGDHSGERSIAARAALTKVQTNILIAQANYDISATGKKELEDGNVDGFNNIDFRKNVAEKLAANRNVTLSVVEGLRSHEGYIKSDSYTNACNALASESFDWAEQDAIVRALESEEANAGLNADGKIVLNTARTNASISAEKVERLKDGIRDAYSRYLDKNLVMAPRDVDSPYSPKKSFHMDYYDDKGTYTGASTFGDVDGDVKDTVVADLQKIKRPMTSRVVFGTKEELTYTTGTKVAYVPKPELEEDDVVSVKNLGAKYSIQRLDDYGRSRGRMSGFESEAEARETVTTLKDNERKQRQSNHISGFDRSGQSETVYSVQQHTTVSVFHQEGEQNIT